MKHKITLLSFCFFLITSFAFAQKTVDASSILQDLKKGKNVSLQNATITGVLDLTYMDEALPNLPKRKRWWNNNGSNEIKKLIESKVSFVNCTFEDDVLAYIPDEDSGYTFIASFEDEVIFKDCVFEQKAMFKYSKFEKNTDFSGSKFERDNTFKYAKFDRNISFSNTTFNEPATFKYAKFNRNVSFANSIFKETTTFKYTKFSDGVSFNNTKFEEDLNLKYTQVTGEFNIKNMNVGYDIDTKYTKINGRSFSKHLMSNN
ncbi:pentapeptide repeat protein [Lutibacter sp. Hel_I_33_5]|uniref:pentapeptide repeat-containing protein n=1 Tax=Lutibacter sp. Hel_I_33_5 TaxID=1566289 RepID=UPI0011A59A9A|nr:pentapeptide repeat-containing protein [Lutibacter sp. Hel_I_33_5]TVZ57355.1 pentapeptide repeat protein [Lutibacter sp. Hel_I_33_5]